MLYLGAQRGVFSKKKGPRVLKHKFPHRQKHWGPPLLPAICYIWSDKGEYFPKLSSCSENSDMASEGLGEMFEGDSAVLVFFRITKIIQYRIDFF
jgi:hypothetical protein